MPRGEVLGEEYPGEDQQSATDEGEDSVGWEGDGRCVNQPGDGGGRYRDEGGYDQQAMCGEAVACERPG